MDPITATATLITFATFIKDLIEVGQSIKESIEKVSENRRQIRELTNDVLRSLADLPNLTRGHEDVYQAPALLGALGDLKADMLHVLQTCRKISPAERSPGFRGFELQLKVWMKRDEIEAEIRRLKEHVINCYIKFTRLVAGGNLAIDTHHITTVAKPVFATPTTPSHILHWILGMVLEIHKDSSRLQLGSADVLLNLGTDLGSLNMTAEAVAWDLFALQILYRFTAHSGAVEIQSWIADALVRLSEQHQHGLQYELALQASQESLDILRSLETLPNADYWALRVTILIVHAQNLSETGQYEIAMTIAQEAVVCAHYGAVMSSKAFFALAKGLTSAGRTFEAYEASKGGFQTVLKFSGSIPPPAGQYIDSFIDHICKVAEENSFSRTMLADNVILFRDLAHHYPKELSSQFLRLLYAYINSITHLDDFNLYGGVLKDVFQAIYVQWPHYTWNIYIPLIKNIFITHFDQAIAVIQELVSSLIADTSLQAWDKLIFMLADLLADMLPFIPHPNQVILSNIGLEIIGHLRQMPSTLQTGWYSLPAMLLRSSWGFQLAGLLDEALAAVDEAIEHRRPSFDSDNVYDVAELRWSHIRRASMLLDMARVSEAMEATQKANTLFLLPSEETDIDRQYLCVFQTRILRRMARNPEAMQMLETFMSRKDPSTDNTFDVQFHFLRTELAATRGEAGYLGKAVHDAEQAVTACRKEVRNTDVENQKVVLVHSLTTLSHCLAAVGRNKEALVVAEEAALIYNSSASHMWGDFLYTTRKQELGGDAFHSLSLRLATSGQPAEALANAEKATDLYRELVSLAPRHLPTLAKSLRNIAVILWKIGRQDESIAAGEEAVNILRKVSDNETYFLGALRETLDQLAGYLFEKGEIGHASAATAESAEVRKRIESLPPPLPFLFMEVKTEPSEETDEDDNEAWETATESDDEYHEVPDARSAAEGAEPAVTDEHEPQFEARINVGATSTLDMTAPGVSPPGENEAARISMLGRSRLLEVLATPLEVSITPMDILWWVLLAVLGITVLWNRM
ncbi:hypothetical protein B0H11DRAFT_2223438 [Mycena galericulata]|nr:hypothetical protein B0H11DRAFT_2223438 [Mycena galericulata]